VEGGIQKKPSRKQNLGIKFSPEVIIILALSTFKILKESVTIFGRGGAN
jgi:hypothetical protein